MERVIVTVKREGEARVRDLEVPAEVEAQRLVDLIAAALRWQTDAAGQRLAYELEAQPLGRRLAPCETLADAGVWDGSWLVLHPVQARAPGEALVRPRTKEKQPATTEAPAGENVTLAGWGALREDRDAGPATQLPTKDTANGEPAKRDGYTWKQLD